MHTRISIEVTSISSVNQAGTPSNSITYNPLNKRKRNSSNKKSCDVALIEENTIFLHASTEKLQGQLI